MAATAAVLGKLAMVIKKDIEKRVHAKRQKSLKKHLLRQNTNQAFGQPLITINEMGQNENAVGLFAQNNNFWNNHLCGVNTYVMLALWFLPMLIIVSFKGGTDFYVEGEIFNFWPSLSKFDKMLMKDCFFYFLINGLYPIMIYANSGKLRRHIKDEFF